MDALKNGWNVLAHHAEEVVDTFAEEDSEELDLLTGIRERAEKTRLYALVGGVAAVAASIFALAAGMMMGPMGVMFGICGFTFFALLALAARDLYIINNKIASPNLARTALQIIRSFNSPEDQVSKLYEDAAKDSLIIRDDVVRWFFFTPVLPPKED